MNARFEDQAIALAGVFQAAALVEQLAKTGYLPSAPLGTCMNGLFNQNPASTLDVFGNDLANIELGLKVMSDLLSHQQSRDYPNTLRYVLGILHLQKKLLGRQDMLAVIGKRLQQSAQQAEHFGIAHENVMARTAAIYSDTVSTFKFRIQVSGDFSYLQQTRVANQVRSLLLSGIRAATLWRQRGGSRLQVIFQRKKLAVCADDLLRNLQKT
ncbi:MAG: high frequency lysogenization protein HflD [Gammaproteobacteria bacterium]|nr:high frequency lysogenization protein HflD [Gammaproteobacteria bacterium]